MDILQEIHLRILDTEELVKLEVRDGRVHYPDGRSDGHPLGLRYGGEGPAGILATYVRPVEPGDPDYALALQDHPPDGLLVEGAVVSGRELTWGELIRRAQRSRAGSSDG